MQFQVSKSMLAQLKKKFGAMKAFVPEDAIAKMAGDPNTSAEDKAFMAHRKAMQVTRQAGIGDTKSPDNRTPHKN